MEEKDIDEERKEKRERKKKYALEHKEEIREYQQNYRKENRERELERAREYKRTHKEELKIYNKEYAQTHTEKIRNYQQNYQQEKKKEIKEQQKEKRTRYKQDLKQIIKKKIGSHKRSDILNKRIEKDSIPDDYIDVEHVLELLEEQQNKCKKCEVKLELCNYSQACTTQFTIDRIDNDLPHTKNNCIITCLSCNVSKSDKQTRRKPAPKTLDNMLNKKINGYRRYDSQRELIDKDNLPKDYITPAFVKELIEKNHGCCEECGEELKLENYVPYDRDQFTLDRIFNYLPHIKSNVWLAHLRCNNARNRER